MKQNYNIYCEVILDYYYRNTGLKLTYDPVLKNGYNKKLWNTLKKELQELNKIYYLNDLLFNEKLLKMLGGVLIINDETIYNNSYSDNSIRIEILVDNTLKYYHSLIDAVNSDDKLKFVSIILDAIDDHNLNSDTNNTIHWYQVNYNKIWEAYKELEE